MSNLTFIIDGQKVDVSESIDFTRIYRGAETTDVKKNNYSLTVKFPFTYTNELIFKRTNSLTYKSSFPYDAHECSVSSNGVVLISQAVLVLLSTTDSFECAMTWDNFDNIGAILNNPMKLGVLLRDFPKVRWDYQDSETYGDDAYSTIKADTYGYCRYVDFTGSAASTYFYTYPHPLINFNYLLGLIFTELGITVNVPVIKNDYLQSLIIRPNKEYDTHTNNVFEAKVLYTTAHTSFINSLQFDYIREGDPIPAVNSFGRNSYYFKSWVDSNGFDDGLAINDGYGNIPQTKRIKAFGNTTNNQMVVTDYTPTGGSIPLFVRYRDGTFTSLFTVGANGTYSFDAEDGDWFYFKIDVSGSQNFNMTITSDILEDSLTPNNLYFPSRYHIPTCIDLTVGEYVNQALQITASELTYDVNSNSYSFSEKTKENGSAYDITNNITSIKEITYDTKYIYSKLGQTNIFKYLSTSPVNADYPVLVANPKLVLEKTFIDLKFGTTLTESGGYYDGFCITPEHNYLSPSESWVQFSEQPLHLLWNDSVNSKIYFHSNLQLSYIFATFWATFWTDLEALALAGTVRLIKLNANISDIEFKRINTKGTVYIKNYGKYYSFIECIKNGDDAEFFLLELY